MMAGNDSVTVQKISTTSFVNSTTLNNVTTVLPPSVTVVSPVNNNTLVDVIVVVNGNSTAISGLGSSSTVVFLNNWLYVMYVVIGVVGIVGNALVALVLLRFTNMRRRLTNIYVINQSLIDLMTSLWLLLQTVFQDPYLPPGLAGDIKCRMWLSKLPFWSSYISSSMNIVAITFERYMKIVHPIKHRNSFTKKRAVISVVCIWLFGYIYNGALMISEAGVYLGVCMIGVFFPSVAAKKIDILTHFVLQYLLPVVVFVFCYSKMAITLRRSTSQIEPIAGSSTLQQPQHQQEQQATVKSKKGFNNVIKTMLIISLMFIVCLSLNQWLFLFYKLDMLNYNIFANPIYPISVISMYLTCCINPFIYATTYQQFREAVKRMLPKKCVDLVQTTINHLINRSIDSGGSDGVDGTLTLRITNSTNLTHPSGDGAKSSGVTSHVTAKAKATSVGQ